MGSCRVFTDYQLRPNYLIVLAVAPELVDPEHGWAAIQTAVKRLLGPLGLAAAPQAAPRRVHQAT